MTFRDLLSRKFTYLGSPANAVERSTSTHENAVKDLVTVRNETGDLFTGDINGTIPNVRFDNFKFID